MPELAVTRIGNLASSGQAVVDSRGAVTPWPGGESVGWSIGAEDRWHDASSEAAVRQGLVGLAPVVETRMRIPGGDAVHRAYGIRTPESENVVLEIENESPVPVAVRFSAPVISARPAAELDFPLPHRTILRVALPMFPGTSPSYPAALPSAAQVANGWALQARSGPRYVVPDPRLADAVAANRCYLMLFRAEAATGQPADYSRLAGLLDAASPTWTWPPGHNARVAAEFMGLVRSILVTETADGLALCAGVPPAWRGQAIEVHDVPTAFGRLSYAVRWHGERPALLWELERHDPDLPVRLTAPGLDPAWASTDAKGEALVA